MDALQVLQPPDYGNRTIGPAQLSDGSLVGRQFVEQGLELSVRQHQIYRQHR